MPQEEIAKILEVPKGTVKSRLHVAIKKLKEELEGDENESRIPLMKSITCVPNWMNIT